MIDGRLPPAPIGGFMAMTAVSVGEGMVKYRCRPDESAYNPIGVVHGGLVCTLLDSVAGCAVHSTLPAGVGFTSLEIKVSCLRPVRQGEGELTATGRVTKPGRRAAFAGGEARDEDGRLIATASSTCLVFPLPEE
ncbi:PaaI family thioesterase [Geodermatophilus sabuli]|uniref:PaaI family thioesterase n=1 Tax=Geodermatophilus sabuli TaxID=1564158 RepID=UPI001953C17C|nr:PaaI family thioesterase [Geodermatophilus sabuli]